MKHINILLQKQINDKKNIFFDKLVEYSPEDIITVIEKEVLPLEVKKTDKIAFFNANKLLLANYVDEGKADEAKSLIQLIINKFDKLIEMEFLALSGAIEEEKEIFEDHPEYKGKFNTVLNECFAEFVKGIDKHKARWEETIRILTPDPVLLSDIDYNEDLLGQDTDNKSDED